MIVSWNWLKQYVDLEMPHDELVERLTMSGLNHEGSEQVYDDLAIDLEVTSNRPDCLGHLGIAREISALYELPLNIPDPQPATGGGAIASECGVEIECPDLCRRYTARLLRGVQITDSPEWLADRLRALDIAVINNVVDATNYVMFECGQPLHAFDFGKLRGGRIVVREPLPGESLVAIDHREYPLAKGMCVIADAERPVAIGGVMGGAETEVGADTTDVLVEAAAFAPLAVRNTARALKLHSPSSFRFERPLNEEQIDWASRRCCELILESGGGKLLKGVIDVGQPPRERQPIVLRLSELKRILGIEIPSDFVPQTLRRLGLEIVSADPQRVEATPPAWRSDLVREVDLVEEVGRIYGYDQVPDNASVPMAASFKTRLDRVRDRIRGNLTAHGFLEAMTPSLVPEPWSEACSPWSDASPLVSSQPMLGVLEKGSQNIGAVQFLRRSLIPSLLEVVRINEFRSNTGIELFEMAKVYLTRGDGELPDQPEKVGLVSERGFFEVKGVLESLVHHLHGDAQLVSVESDLKALDVDQSAALQVDGSTIGWVGKVSRELAEAFRLRRHVVVAEIDVAALSEFADLIPHHRHQSLFPPVARDFNFVLADSVRWSQLESVVTEAAGELLESVEYRETFRDAKKDGPGKKRLLLSVILRSNDETLTGEQADQVSQRIVQACEDQLSAALGM